MSKLSALTTKISDFTKTIRLYAVDMTTPSVPVQGYSLITELINYIRLGLYDDRQSYDASSNLFPSTGGSGAAGVILRADIWTISVAGTLGGTAVVPGQTVRALVDSPAQTASNWAISASGGGGGFSGYTLNAATAWDGTAYAPDMTTQDVDERTINDTVTTLVLNNPVNIQSDGIKKYIVIDNSGNSSAISSITFGANYNFPVGVEPTGMAAGEIATLELFNNLGTVRCDWTIDA